MTQQLEMFAGPAAAPEPGPAVKLRPYQEESINSFYNLEHRGVNRFLLQLATGLGKTVVFSEYSRRLDRPTLMLAHRDELIQQAVAKLRAIWPGVDVGIVKAERNESGHQVTVASVQTLSRERRFNMAFQTQAAVSRLGLVVTDESHHSYASTYKNIYSRFGLMEKGGHCLHLGVTATPKRGDGKALDDVFDEIAYSMGIREGILDGYLSDLSGYTMTFQNSDMADVKLSHGEYDQEALEKAVKKVARNEAIVECWQERAKLEDGSSYRQTIAFCVTVSHAETLTQAFSKAGVKADLIHGELPDDKRAAVLHRYATGKTQVICNVGVLTEGYDNPATSCIIVARPTRSQALFIQMIGRGTRLYPGKRNCLILDVADVSGKMNVIAPVTLSGALGLVATDGKPTKEVQSVVKQLKMKLRAEGLGPGVEEADAEGGKDFDPFADPFAGQDGINFRWATGKSGLTIPLPQKQPDSRHYLVIQRRDDWLFDVVHVRQEKRENAGGYPQWKTTGEKFVNDHGLPDEAWAAGEAEKYAKKIVQGIDRIKDRDAQWRSGPASEGQFNFLTSKGLWPAEGVSKGQASTIMDGYFASKIKVELKRPTGQLEFV